MPRGRQSFNAEPLLRDVLADPIVLALMAGDGTTKSELVALIATVRLRLANAQPAQACGMVAVARPSASVQGQLTDVALEDGLRARLAGRLETERTIASQAERDGPC